MKIDYTKLWHLDDAMKRRSLIVRCEKRDMDNEDIWKLIKGEIHPKEPVTYRYHMGGEPKDLVATTYPPRYLLSDRIVETLRVGRFTGWSEYPVSITGKNGRPITGYHGFSITGRGAPMDTSRGIVVEAKKHQLDIGQIKGLYLEKDSWDGSDVFLIKDSGYICVTQPVYEAITALNPSNIELVQLEEVRRLLL